MTRLIPRQRAIPDRVFQVTLDIAVGIWRKAGIPEEMIAELVERARRRW